MYSEILLASRTLSKCDDIAAQVLARTGRTIRTARVDADNVPEMTAPPQAEKPFMVLNVALPYPDLSILEACPAAGVHHLSLINMRRRRLPYASFFCGWECDANDRAED